MSNFKLKCWQHVTVLIPQDHTRPNTRPQQTTGRAEHLRGEITAEIVGVDVCTVYTATVVRMRVVFFSLFVSLAMASVTPSQENIIKKIQKALQFHKTGEFENALRLYDEVIPYLNGKIASQICGNAGALYLQQGIPSFPRYPSF